MLKEKFAILKLLKGCECSLTLTVSDQRYFPHNMDCEQVNISIGCYICYSLYTLNFTG